MSQITPQSSTDHTHDIHDYEPWLESVRVRFAAAISASRHLFMVQQTGKPLFELFLESLPEENGVRQHYRCSSCRRFLENYGGLVQIQPDGTLKSVLWDSENVAALYKPGVTAMRRAVERSTIDSVFFSSEKKWGVPATKDPKHACEWHHLAVIPPASLVFKETRTLNASQAMAEKKEEHGMLARALHQYPKVVADEALKLLQSGSLYRAEKHVNIAQWFVALHDSIASACVNHSATSSKDKLIWNAVATAPAGFCHVSGSMLGTLLADITSGLSFDVIKKNFDARMDPLAYRRAVAAPSGGQIREAEKAVEDLGIAPAFARRYLTGQDLSTIPEAILWAPGEIVQKETKQAKTSSGIFDHLKPAQTTAPPSLSVPPKMMTWEKFQREVLPGAARIGYVVPAVGRFASITTAQDPNAPQILQWDSQDRRNTAAWSFPAQAARADEWSLTPGTIANVRTIVTSPNLWTGNEQAARHGQGVFLLLEGAADKRGLPGGGLFTEHLRGDLAKYRTTIEAHLNKLIVAGADDPDTIGFGIGLMAGADWTEVAAPKLVAQDPSRPRSTPSVDNVHAILVLDNSGSMSNYLSAARAAVRSLINAIKSMPGNVDATVFIFGDSYNILAVQSTISALDGLEMRLNARSGNTALNDTIIAALSTGNRFRGANDSSTVFFLGIVTDGDENHSASKVHDVRQYIQMALATGRWTIAYAGAGSNPRAYAQQIGIPDGNIATFSASSEGFRDIGQRYSDATRGLGASYASGAKSSTSFFGAASARQAIGTDHPVLIVTSRSGSQSAYKLDCWD